MGYSSRLQKENVAKVSVRPRVMTFELENDDKLQRPHRQNWNFFKKTAQYFIK